MKSQIDIAYYSGTGGTRRVANQFRKQLLDLDICVNVTDISNPEREVLSRAQLLILLFPVHASNAPLPVIKWLNELEHTYDKAAVICVSGGGEMPPNTGAREGCIKLLQKKGTDVFYENMIIMPSNWIVGVPDTVALTLLQVLPEKVTSMIDSIVSGKRRRVMPLFIDQIFSLLLKIEHVGAKILGKSMIVDDKCNGCSLCAKSCSTQNIKMVNNKPVFNNKCSLCLSCIYVCPKKAISLKYLKGIVVKEGYDLSRLEEMLPLDRDIDIRQEIKGFIWYGVRKYLNE